MGDLVSKDIILENLSNNDFIQVSCGTYHCTALKADGSLASWGDNSYNQVTDTPIGNDFIQVSCGTYHCTALKADGSLVSWGYEYRGSVSNTPTGNDFIQVSCGVFQCTALKSNGSLVSWGYDDSGNVSNTPIGNDFIQVSCGRFHCTALRKDGSLVSWGNNTYKQVSDTPTGNNFIQVSCGTYHCTALKADGSLASWGDNSYNTPIGNDFIQVSCGSYHCTALKVDGSLVSWGNNSNSVVTTTPTGNNFIQVSCGTYHCTALKADGSLVSWGSNDSNIVSNTPIPIKYLIEYNNKTYSLDSSNKVIEISDSSEASFDQYGIIDSTKLSLFPNIDNIVISTKSSTSTSYSATIEKFNHTLFAISKDGSTFYSYKNGSWIIPSSRTDLMSSTELNALIDSNYYNLGKELFKNDNIYIKAFFYKYLDTSMPLLNNISVEYNPNNKVAIIDTKLSMDTIHEEYTTLTARLKDLEGDKISYRILIQNYLSFTGIDGKITPTMTSNTQDGFITTSSGVYIAGTYESYKAFDGKITDSNNCWLNDYTINGFPQYLQIEIPDSVPVYKYKITSRNFSTVAAPTKWDLLGSNDGVSWTIIDSRIEDTWVAAQTKEFSIETKSPYRYFKLNIHSSNHSSFIAIAEFEVYKDLELSNFNVVDDWFETNKYDYNLTKSYNYPYFSLGTNTIRIEAKDQRGLISTQDIPLTLSSEAPIVGYTNTPYEMELSLSDPEGDQVSIQISLDDNVILPFTPYMNTPRTYKYEWDHGLITVGNTHTIKIEAKDKYGAIHTESFTFTGEMKDLLFKDDQGNLYTTDKGEILKYLNFGEIIAGQITEPVTVTLLNKTNNALDAVNLTMIDSNLPENIKVVFGDDPNKPFTEDFNLLGIMNHGDEKEFMVKIQSQPGGGVTGGEFEIEATGKIV